MSQEVKLSDVSAPETVTSAWQGKHVYLLSIVCLILGVVVGYLMRGSQSVSHSAVPVGVSQPASDTTEASSQPPTLEKMKQMADKSASPLIEKLKADPNNFEALNDAGKVYRATHQFKEAAGYYQMALQVDPKNVATRTDLASCLYYTGDVDGALAQLDKALTYDPKFFGALLNIGIIRMQGKNDVAGAVAAWQKIVTTDNDAQHKQIAKKLIADAQQKNTKETGETQRANGT